ncbi:MAG TPA: tetratricopeptide repeat protein [Polyangiaceae bacterium]|nr:tetratricopeptide repeat protein [Polyangiaceae bacterium]
MNSTTHRLGRIAAALLIVSCKSQDESKTVAASLRVEPAAPAAAAKESSSVGAPCASDDAKACFERAQHLEHGTHGSTPDRASAAAAYRIACDRGHADACNALGELAFFGDRANAPDKVKGAEHISQACNLGSIQGCTNLGYLYANGQGLAADPSRAASAHQRALSLSLAACEGGDARSCSIAGGIYGQGRPGIEKDASRAASAYRAAAAHAKVSCDAGNAADCSLLAGLHADGRGVPADNAAAVQLLRRACDAGELDACSQLGLKLASTPGEASPGAAQAVEYYDKACDGGDARGCFLLALSHADDGPGKDMALAAVLYEKACDRAHSGACVNLGRLYENGEGGRPKDEALARALYEQGCNRGDSVGCKNLSILQRQDEQAAFRKNLKIGDVSHCGLVTEVNGPIVRVQAMVGMYWMKLDQIYPAGQQRCSFYNNLYQDPG